MLHIMTTHISTFAIFQLVALIASLGLASPSLAQEFIISAEPDVTEPSTNLLPSLPKTDLEKRLEEAERTIAKLTDQLGDQRPAEPTEVEERLAAIEEQLRKEKEAADKEVVAEASESGSTLDQWEGWTDTSDEKWTHKIGGRLLGETVMWSDAAGIPRSQNYTEIRQVRLSMAGTGYGVLDYRIQMDFEPEARNTFDLDDNNIPGDSIVSTTFGSVGMKDLYVGVHDVPGLGYVRVGHFKVSFSHDQLLSRRDMTFMERYPMADPNGFTPGREIGIQSHNYSANQKVTWQVGAFVDNILETAKELVDDNQGFVLNARGTWTPYYDEPSGGRYLVHLGLGALYTRPENDSGRFLQRPEIHEGPPLIDTGPITANDYTVLGTEALVHWGPVYVNHELMWANVNAAGGNINLYSGYVEAGAFLTGEHRNYERNLGFFGDMEPFENAWFTPGCCGRGAWEVAARWSFVDFSQSPNASKYNSLNLALNWYWNPRMRVQMNWIQPYTDGAPLGNTDPQILSLRVGAFF